jgi:hypothetical protein
MCQFNPPTLKNAFIEFNMHPIIVEIITTTIIHMNLTLFPTISSPFIMYPYLKDVSIACNFNQKQHATCVHVDEAHVAQLIYMIILHLQNLFFT